MSKTIQHLRDGSNNVHLLQRKYIGNGRFYQRGIIKGVEVGDKFESFTCLQILVVDKIISVSDSKSSELSEEDKKDAHVEIELTFPGFINEEMFINRPNNFGN